MARAGLVGNFLTDLDDAVAARWRFDAGSLILSRPGWSTAGSLAGPSAWGPSSGARLARLLWGRLLLEELCNRPSFHRSFASTAEQATVMMWHIR